MLQLIDYYKVLQVDPTAHVEVVRAAYRVLARMYHPDVESGSAEKMVALNNAWAVISDEKLRAAYDRSRVALEGRSATPTAGTQREASYSREPVRTAPSPSPTIRSSVLNFGRYEGWTLEQVARQDPNFLEWFARMPIGRPFKAEIESVLATVRGGGSTTAVHRR